MQLCTAHVNNADTVGKSLITSWVACLRLTTYITHTYAVPVLQYVISQMPIGNLINNTVK